MSESKYLFTDDLCHRYRVKRWTVWHWVKLGKLPKPDKSLGRPRWSYRAIAMMDYHRTGDVSFLLECQPPTKNTRRFVRVSPPGSKAQKIRANGLINAGIKRGTIKRPDLCQECGKACIPDGHHDDYRKPKKVSWLCRSCHSKAHWRPVSNDD